MNLNLGDLLFSPPCGKTQNKTPIGAHQKQLFGMALPSGGQKIQLYVHQEVKYSQLVVQITKRCNQFQSTSSIHLDTVLLNQISTLFVCFEMTNSWLVICTNNKALKESRVFSFHITSTEHHSWEKQLFQYIVFMKVFWDLCNDLTQTCLTQVFWHLILYKQQKPDINCSVTFSFPLFISSLFNCCFPPLLLKKTLFLKAKCTCQTLFYPQTSQAQMSKKSYILEMRKSLSCHSLLEKQVFMFQFWSLR